MSEQDNLIPEAETPVQKPKKRGRIRYAAPLGFLVLIFAFIGIITRSAIIKYCSQQLYPED